MGYYENKKKAFEIIDNMLENKSDIRDIEFTIASTFGFGKKIVQNRIDDLTIQIAKKKKNGTK